MECKWKKQKAPDQVKSVKELYPCPKEYNCLGREISNEDRSWFYQELKKYGNFTGTLWLLSPEAEKSNVLPVITVEEVTIPNTLLFGIASLTSCPSFPLVRFPVRLEEGHHLLLFVV